jgi:hypothetical protein
MALVPAGAETRLALRARGGDVKKEHRSEAAADGTAWTVEATMVDGHVTAEVVGASEADGTIGVQLTIDGDQSHLAMVEDIASELQSSLYGAPRARRPGAYRLATIRQELPRAYQRWTEADEALLLERWDAGDTIEMIARTLERGAGGIRSRLVKLGRLEEAS